MSAPIHWRKRWQREETATGPRRVLISKEGYRVVHCLKGIGGLSPIVYALRDRQTVISRHRKPAAAMKACQRDHQAAPRRPK